MITIVGDWFSDEDGVPDTFVLPIETNDIEQAMVAAAQLLAGSGHCEECEDPENVFTGARCAYIIAAFPSEQKLPQIDEMEIAAAIRKLEPADGA